MLRAALTRGMVKAPIWVRMPVMGWRAQHAYDEAQREDWRRFMAAQPLRRRLIIRGWQVLMVAAIGAFVAVPCLAVVLHIFF